MNFMQSFVFPVLVSASVGVGFGIVGMKGMSDRHEERFTHVEARMDRHEENFQREVLRLDQSEHQLVLRTDDQERRLAKLEGIAEETRAALSETRASLREIQTDIKTLLRGNQ